MRIPTVTRKAIPQPTAATLKGFFSIKIRAEYSGEELINSEVISSIMAVTASHRPISESERGKIICFQPWIMT